MPYASPRHREPEHHEPSIPVGDKAASMLVFDREAARAVDQAAINEFGIPGIVLMENAARGLVAAATEMIGDRAGPALIICGTGNNGGDGFALARHLHNHGIQAALVSLGEPSPESEAAKNLHICQQMNLKFISVTDLDSWTSANRPSLIVDAIFGTGPVRPVTGQSADIISWINSANVPVLAVDVPSGMDCDTGEPHGCCVQASRTVTFVGLKAGFLAPGAQKLLGEVSVADIGAPRELLERFGRRIPIHRPDAAKLPIGPSAGTPAR